MKYERKRHDNLNAMILSGDYIIVIFCDIYIYIYLYLGASALVLLQYNGAWVVVVLLQVI